MSLITGITCIAYLINIPFASCNTIIACSTYNICITHITYISGYIYITCATHKSRSMCYSFLVVVL